MHVVGMAVPGLVLLGGAGDGAAIRPEHNPRRPGPPHLSPRRQRRRVPRPRPALTLPVSAVASHEQERPARPPSASEPANSQSRNSRTRSPAVDITITLTPSTPAVDRDLVVEGPWTADCAEEIDLRWCGFRSLSVCLSSPAEGVLDLAEPGRGGRGPLRFLLAGAQGVVDLAELGG
jgi:hypothetical protein